MGKRMQIGTALGVMFGVLAAGCQGRTNGGAAEAAQVQRVISGEIARVPVEIDGGEVARIDEVRRSCGCLRVLSSDQQELSLPLEIAHDRKERIYIEVATVGRVGLTPFSVQFYGTSQGQKTSKTAEFELDILPGWILTPRVIRRDHCEENETIESEVKVFRHELASDLELEEVITSNSQRMSADVVKVDPSDSVVENELQLVAIAKLQYEVTSDATSDTLTFVGGDGQVRAHVNIIATMRGPQLTIKPDVLYWAASDSTRIAWIEHRAGLSPKVVSPLNNFDVTLGETRPDSESRAVTKVMVTARSSSELQGVAVDARLDDANEVVFGCGADRIALRVLRK